MSEEVEGQKKDRNDHEEPKMQEERMEESDSNIREEQYEVQVQAEGQRRF